MGKKTIFLTGVTGFLGSHIAQIELLKGNRVVCLARGSSSENISAQQRVYETLLRFDMLPALNADNLVVVEASLSDSPLVLQSKIAVAGVSGIDLIIHCVATFKIKEKDRAEIVDVNINGTKNILGLLDLMNKGGAACRYFHVSTAYSHGRSAEPIKEQLEMGERDYRSLYEWSKHCCEQEIERFQRHTSYDITIVRPSIIIGSPGNKIISRAGYYQFCEELYSLCKRYEVNVGTSFDGCVDVRFAAVADGNLNLIPVDFVVKAISCLSDHKSLRSDRLKIFNLVNENPPTLTLILQQICSCLNVRGVEMVHASAFNHSPHNPLEKLFERKIVFQAPYLRDTVHFETIELRKYISHLELPTPDLNENYLNIINSEFFRELDKEYVKQLQPV